MNQGVHQYYHYLHLFGLIAGARAHTLELVSHCSVEILWWKEWPLEGGHQENQLQWPTSFCHNFQFVVQFSVVYDFWKGIKRKGTIGKKYAMAWMRLLVHLKPLVIYDNCWLCTNLMDFFPFPSSSIKLYAGNLDLSVVSKGHQEKRGIASKAKKWFLELETEVESSSISGKHYRLMDFEAKTEVICFIIFKERGHL